MDTRHNARSNELCRGEAECWKGTLMKLYQGYDRAELCHQYNARATVTGEYLAALLAQYSSRSADMRARLRCFCDIAYGPHADEALDIFPAENGNGPVLVFIHADLWSHLTKNNTSFL